MKYCKRCVMPDTRPGIVFENGVCSACLNYEKKKHIDWDQRWQELEKLCSKYRDCNDDDYDCAIAVSGGKDSHFQVYIMKELLGMNPLLLTVNGFSWTETGQKNIANISDAYGCDVLSLNLNRKAFKIMAVKALKELGSPMWYYDAAIYAFPYKIAMKLGLKLLIYGENVNYEYGGKYNFETPNALDQFKNDVVKPIDFKKWIGNEITMKDLEVVKFPTYDEMEKAGLEPIYLSYFVLWDSHHNYEVAKRHGFHHMDHEYKREGTIENYNQIDSLGYLINQWFKYPKYGHASVTEMASRWIRAGRLTREEAIPLVKKYDKCLDQGALDEFLEFTGLTVKEFWEITDKWYNPNLFEKDKFGVWKEKFDLRETNSKEQKDIKIITT